LFSRILEEVEVNLRDTWSDTFIKLEESVLSWKDFIANSPDGWHL
jgi:hypothetical protein